MDIPAELVTLGVAGANTLVQSMATDVWQQVRERFARVLARDDPSMARSLEKLDRSRAEILERANEDREKQMQLAVGEWTVRLRDLMEDEPKKVDDLRETLAFCQGLPGMVQANTSNVNQVAWASDKARIYQATGNQSIHEPGNSSR